MNSLDQKFAELNRSIARYKKALIKNKHKKTIKAALKLNSDRERDSWLEENLYRI